MLSLTGSLLDDPSNPPALPTVTRRTPSASPELPEPPAKRPYRPRASAGKPGASATPSKSQHTTFEEPAGAEPATAAEAEPEVDTSKMTARELKKYRKEQEKAKRDARKARKEGAVGDGVETGTKRKADEEDGGERKKRKEA